MANRERQRVGASDHGVARAGAADSTRWYVVGLLTLGMSVAYVDRVNLSVAISDIGRLLSLTPQQQGLALSAFFFSYALFQIPSGWLVDRYGVRTPYIAAFVLWSLASASMALTASLTWLIAMRLLLGVGEAVVMPASMRYIRMHFEEKQRGLAVGLYITGTKIGPAIGFPIAAYLLAGYGWRPMFVLSGLVPLLWIVPYLRWVGKDDIAAVAANGPGVRLTTPDNVSARAILASPAMWGTVLGTFCYMYFFYFCMTWMPIYVRERHGLSVTETGWFTGAAFAGMAATAILGGRFADALIGRGHDPVKIRKIFTLAGFALAVTQTAAVFTTSTSLILFLSAFSLCGLGVATANYWALTQTLIPGGAIGTVVGIQNTAGSLAGVAAPVLTGWIIEKTGSFDAPIAAVGAWLLIGAASYVFLVRRKYAPPVRRVGPESIATMCSVPTRTAAPSQATATDPS